MTRWKPAFAAGLLLLFPAWTAAPAGGDKPSIVYSATFAYYEYPKDLWAARLARLKSMGFNTVQLPLRRDWHEGAAGGPDYEGRTLPGRDLVGLLRLARQLGLHVWIHGDGLPPALQRFLASHGGPVLDSLPGNGVSWFPAEETPAASRRLLNPADFASLHQLLQKLAAQEQFPALSGFDAGWPAGEDIRARSSDPSNYLLATRELLAAGAKALNHTAVLEGLAPADREPALSIANEFSPQAAVLNRNGGLLRQFGRLLAETHPFEDVALIAGTAPNIEQGLHAAGFHPQAIDLTTIPAARLQQFGAVVLPVSRASLSAAAEKKLVSYVEAGGALIATPRKPRGKLGELYPNQMSALAARLLPESSGAGSRFVVAGPSPTAVRRAIAAVGVRPAVRLVLGPQQKPFPLLRLGMLVSSARRGPAFVSALNYGEDRPAAGVLEALDPRTGKRILLRSLNLPPRQALLMPLNLPLAAPEVCLNCSSFTPEERLVSATAELDTVAFENGVLSLEFVAPGEGELVLELAQKPEGPLITAARLRDFDWDEKTRRLRLRIPAGRPPDFRSRVALGIRPPDTSVFLKAAPRLIIGSTALVTASFSSPELAARSRLLAPSGWRVQAESSKPGETEYSVEIPANAIGGDTVTLALEMEGKIAQSLQAPLIPPFSLRVQPEEVLHPRRDTKLPIRPHLATLNLPGRRTYRLYLHNNCDEIKTFELSAAGEGLRFTPPRQEVSIGPNLEREVTVYAAPVQPRAGLYYWYLEVREGTRKTETPLALAVIDGAGSLAYEFDMDRDGYPELVLENQRLRAVFSPHQGGRSTEFLLKDLGLNAFSLRGALEGGSAMEGRVAGPGRIELRSGELLRRISLGGKDMFFEVEQSGGGPDEWAIFTSSNTPSTKVPGFADEPTGSLFAIVAPGAKIDTERKPYSTLFRLRFPEGGPHRARFFLDRVEEEAFLSQTK